MEIKKTPQADLESERITFFLLGFTVALASLFVMLEWRTEETLSPHWEGFSSIYIENEYNEPLTATPVETETKIEKNDLLTEETQKVAYENFTIVEETPDTEYSDPGLLEGIAESEPEVMPEKTISREAVAELIYTEAERMPQYPGGYVEMNRYLIKNLTYPASASSQRIQGRVWCSFVVNKDGSLSQIQIERGVYISLDQEALRVLKAMPAWIPGTIRSEPVRVKVYLPIVFKL
ncbi:protein TonB [Bacteroidia bacterium]|nr:protein TonB [Bacteroidia bacterium]